MEVRHANAGISLRETLPEGRIYGGRDIRFQSCTADPQRVRAGGLYVALQLPDFDGHEFVDQALRSGAKAIVAERPLAVPRPVCVVPDSREALGQICQRLAGDPSQRLRTIGISGTNGKTVTSLLVAAILKAAGEPAGVLNTIAHSDGDTVRPAKRTTPEAGELAQWLARMAAGSRRSAVLEISSRALAERRIAGVGLDAAVLTNVRRDHLDYHGSLRNYRAAKAQLLRHLKPGGFVVLNADDPSTRYVAPATEHPVVTVGMRMPADLTARVVERHAGEQTFLLTAGRQIAAVQTAMLGDHHVHNCLAAAAVGIGLGFDLVTVARGLETVNSIPGRLEPLACGQPFGVWVDYARTPDTLAAALRAVRRVTSGRVICVFGSDARRDPALRPLLGRVVERGADRGIITNDNPRHESPLEIAHDILDGYDRPSRAHLLPDRAEAIRWALSQAEPGDGVLIAGKGDQATQAVGTCQSAFDDRQIARQWLYEVGAKIDYPQPELPIVKFPCLAQLAN